MFGPKKPSRILNDSGFVFGLSLPDFVFVVAVFVGSSTFLAETPYSLFSFLLAMGTAGVLIPIRMHYRAHSIRDWVAWKLSRGRF